MSGDIEWNPGPVQNDNNQDMAITLPSSMLLELKFHQLYVGGAGNFFRASVSHQLYGDSKFHLDILTAGIEYLNENPERFIESNTNNSWMEYPANESKQGTWTDRLMIQAIADKLKLRMHTVESHQHFAELNVIEAASSIQEPRVICLGHADEYYCVNSTSLGNFEWLKQTFSTPQ